MISLQNNIWGKQIQDKVFKIFIVIHFLNLAIWFYLAFNSAGRIKDCYVHLFNKYLAYSLFNWIEVIYMFAGQLLLASLYKIAKIGGLIIFESILLALIFIYWKIYTC